MKLSNIRIKVTNSIGGFGYNFQVIAYLLLACALLVLAFSASSYFLTPAPDPNLVESRPSGSIGQMSLPAQVALYSFSGLVAVTALITFMVLPYFIAKYSSRLTRRLLGLVRPEIGVRDFTLTKLALAILPLIGFYTLSFWLEGRLFEALYMASFIMITATIVCFLIQSILAWKFKLPPYKLW